MTGCASNQDSPAGLGLVFILIWTTALSAGAQGLPDATLTVARKWAATSRVGAGNEKIRTWLSKDKTQAICAVVRGLHDHQEARVVTRLRRTTRTLALQRCLVLLLGEVYPLYGDGLRLYAGLSQLPNKMGLQARLEHDAQYIAVPRAGAVCLLAVVPLENVIFDDISPEVLDRAWVLGGAFLASPTKAPAAAVKLLERAIEGGYRNRILFLRLALALNAMSRRDAGEARYKAALRTIPVWSWEEIALERKTALALGDQARAKRLERLLKQRKDTVGADARLRLVLDVIDLEVEGVYECTFNKAKWLLSVGCVRAPLRDVAGVGKMREPLLLAGAEKRARKALDEVVAGKGPIRSIQALLAQQENTIPARLWHVWGDATVVCKQLTKAGMLTACVVVVVRLSE